VNRRLAAATCSLWLLAHEFFYPEDGGDKFLRNVGLHKIYTASIPEDGILQEDLMLDGKESKMK
jgi:hypothetical protein